MKKVKCRKCGFNNPLNQQACLRCDSSLEMDFSEMVSERIMPLLSNKKVVTFSFDSPDPIDPSKIQHFVTFQNQNYFLHKLLGEGSYCDVYLVENSKTNQLFAIKLLRLWKVSARDREDVETRFWIEYQMALNKSEYLVCAYERGMLSGNPFYVMEYCDGNTLHEKIGSLISDAKLIKISIDILKGLEVIHRESAVHRDLKPNNIVFKGNYAKLIDFGILGKKNIKITQKGVILGTDVYMAPEWFDAELKELYGRKPTIDIFSFGVLLFELLTGGYYPHGHPPSMDNPEDYERQLVEYSQKVRNNQWENLSYFISNGTIRPFWQQVIEKCIIADPAKRFQTVDEIIKVLDEVNLDIFCSKCNTEKQNRTEIFCSNCGNYLLNGIINLRVIIGRDLNAIYNLTDMILKKGAILIGRRQSLDIEENDISIHEFETMITTSRYHATIEFSRKTGLWFIRDGQYRLNKSGEFIWQLSTNGVYVNGEKASVDGQAFFPNDNIGIGNTTFKVEFTPFIEI